MEAESNRLNQMETVNILGIDEQIAHFYSDRSSYC